LRVARVLGVAEHGMIDALQSLGCVIIKLENGNGVRRSAAMIPERTGCTAVRSTKSVHGCDRPSRADLWRTRGYRSRYRPGRRPACGEPRSPYIIPYTRNS